MVNFYICLFVIFFLVFLCFFLSFLPATPRCKDLAIFIFSTIWFIVWSLLVSTYFKSTVSEYHIFGIQMPKIWSLGVQNIAVYAFFQICWKSWLGKRFDKYHVCLFICLPLYIAILAIFILSTIWLVSLCPNGPHIANKGSRQDYLCWSRWWWTEDGVHGNTGSFYHKMMIMMKQLSPPKWLEWDDPIDGISTAAPTASNNARGLISSKSIPALSANLPVWPSSTQISIRRNATWKQVHERLPACGSGSSRSDTCWEVHWGLYRTVQGFGHLDCRAGQFWVIISDFFLQLNLCVCYRENHFRPITDLCRTLLTPARSHIWPVNKLTRKKSCIKLSKLPRAHNEHVPWFHDPMLSK